MLIVQVPGSAWSAGDRRKKHSNQVRAFFYCFPQDPMPTAGNNNEFGAGNMLNQHFRVLRPDQPVEIAGQDQRGTANI